MGHPPVALVLVSHSRALAEGLAELAGQMAPDVVLLPAGGTGDGGLGTGFDRVLEAVEAAVADGGFAVVLTDLGSAVLTTESVLEMLEPEDVARVRVADAPFVEGAVEAAVVAQGGADVDTVLEAARDAGAGFATGAAATGPAAAGERTGDDADVAGAGAEHDPAGSGAVPPQAPAGPGEPAGSRTDGGPEVGPAPGGHGGADHAGNTEPLAARGTAVLRNRLGLHARPAASVARTAGAFRSAVTIDGADARSVLALVGLGATGGREVVVAANGPDARTAVNAVVAELENGFGEA